jgi:uncharacterized protein YndB with AHSA1/START domain
MTSQQDLDFANRSPDIHWPDDFSPDQAAYFTHNELHIDAPCEKVWQQFIAATKWPEWFALCKQVEIISGGDELQEGALFRWTSSVIAEAKVHEFVPYSRIGWYGNAPGAEPTFYHAWYFAPDGQGCSVIYDEVGKGKVATQLRERDEGKGHRDHDLMLAGLKWASER